MLPFPLLVYLEPNCSLPIVSGHFYRRYGLLCIETIAAEFGLCIIFVYLIWICPDLSKGPSISTEPFCVHSVVVSRHLYLENHSETRVQSAEKIWFYFSILC